MLTLIGSPATRTRRVMWMLEELGLPYEHDKARPHADAVMRLNPSGKVPILIDGDAVLTDSVAIMTYLADKHGRFTCPAGSLDRARQDAFTCRIIDELEGPLWVAAKHSFVLPEEHRVAEIKPSLKWEFGEALRRLSADMGDGPYLMGENMTVPDIVLAHCLSWAEGAKFPVEGDAIHAFRENMMARPAAQKAYAD